MAVFLHVRNNQNQHHNRLMKPRVFRDRTHPLDAYDDEEIKARYRLSRALILQLHDMIQIELEPKTNRNKAVPAILQIFGTLRYYACGSFQHVVGDGLGLHRSTVSRIIHRVTNAIVRQMRRFINFPRNREETQQTKEDFHDVARFPQVLGAIDGTLIAISTPSEDEHLYVSRKGGHSLNVLAICNANLKFTYVVSKYPGSTNDAFVWGNSNLQTLFENGDIRDGWLLGDSGYVSIN